MSLARQNVVLASIAALAGAIAIPAAAQNDPPPPPESIVCPAIEEDGMICASDPLRMDGNCVSFTAAADRLGALYRAEVQKLGAGSKDSLLSTSWWGCGPSSLYDVKKLLVSIGSEPAKVVLTTEPYRSLPAVPTPPPPPPDAPFSCIDLQNPVERNVCVGVRLNAVRSYHDAAYANCKSVVTPGPLLDQLTAAEKTFQAELEPLCAADTAEAGENAKFQAFDRSSCMVTAYQRRTRSMFDLHPECRPQD